MKTNLLIGAAILATLASAWPQPVLPQGLGDSVRAVRSRQAMPSATGPSAPVLGLDGQVAAKAMSDYRQGKAASQEKASVNKGVVEAIMGK